MSNNLVIFKRHFEQELKSINSEFDYKVALFNEIDKGQINLNEKQFLLVITPMPSRSYGDGAITQQIEIKAMCHQKYLDDAFIILSLYQNNVVNKKYFDDSIMINESWYSPSIQENFVEFSVNKGATISMTGAVTFSNDIVDVEYILLNNQRVKLFDFMESYVCEPLANETFASGGRKKSRNRTGLFKLDFKIKNSNCTFCSLARSIRKGDVSTNTIIPVTIMYTDGDSASYNMIISNQVLNANDGIPTLTVSLLERLGDI